MRHHLQRNTIVSPCTMSCDLRARKESSSQVHGSFQVSALFPTWRVIVLQNSHKQLTSTRMTCLTTRCLLLSTMREWKQFSELLPVRMVDALQQCDEIEFPTILFLLKHALTLHITTCENERSFSQLNIIL